MTKRRQSDTQAAPQRRSLARHGAVVIKLIPPLQVDAVLIGAHSIKHLRGRVVIISDEGSGTEVVLNEKEVLAIHKWLGEALHGPSVNQSGNNEKN